MNRQEALTLLNEKVKNKSLLKHSLASEAVMRKLAKRLGKDEDCWGLAGLLHDLDTEIVAADPKKHGLVTKEILEEKKLGSDIIEAIVAHNEHALCDNKRTKDFHHALACAETITGLITAVSLVYPDKKLASVKVKSVVKRMKEKSFAASVSRESIMECEKLGISLEDFSSLALQAMNEIADKLEL